MPSPYGGNLVPRDAGPRACIFPIETPNIMDTDGWRWDRAYALLTGGSKLITSASTDNIVKIVPMPDPLPSRRRRASERLGAGG